ncbi:hypothetical protein GGX14DRAFT_637631 [Mycena pura]|uniref:Uncharacterized protein n=1 Tax=Mycena pura TaxID=153505 RepID=A0AAD6V984_9AGAR|nr:hypothetical protein GGX14DRAFT_637631 [Mycena pura]
MSGASNEPVRICRRSGVRRLNAYGRQGTFSLTAAAIAREVGIITGPEKAINHLADLPLDTPLAEIPAYDADKPEDAPQTSLVPSGAGDDDYDGVAVEAGSHGTLLVGQGFDSMCLKTHKEALDGLCIRECLWRIPETERKTKVWDSRSSVRPKGEGLRNFGLRVALR